MVTIEYLYQLFVKSSGVCTDTRNIGKNSMFFALKGANFNGNLFAEEALEKGARFAIVDENVSEHEDVFQVDNVLSTLQELAAYHRSKMEFPVIGITGTNGKTTSKELIQAVLSTEFETYATKGNLNNHIGVPLTLLSIPLDAGVAVIEMGANKPGDIKELCDIAKPDYGIITNVGKAHLEGFGSFDGVKRTKGELYDAIEQRGGILFINASNLELQEMLDQRSLPKDKVVSYLGEEGVSVRMLDQTPFVRLEIANEVTVETQLVGGYNFENMAAAITIADYFGVSINNISNALKSYSPDNNRSQVVKAGSNTLLMDAYNANPTSMNAALLNFKEIESPKKVVILGDMFELGEETEKEHQTIVDLVKSIGVDLAVFCGQNFSNCSFEGENNLRFKTAEEVAVYLDDSPISQGLILLKGSRGMRLESLVGHLDG